MTLSRVTSLETQSAGFCAPTSPGCELHEAGTPPPRSLLSPQHLDPHWAQSSVFQGHVRHGERPPCACRELHLAFSVYGLPSAVTTNQAQCNLQIRFKKID